MRWRSLFLSAADSVWWMVVGWCGVQASLNAMLAAVTAMVPDQVPVARRGRIGGIVAVAQTVGVVAGTGIAAATGSIAAGYLATAAFLLVLVVPFCFTRERRRAAAGAAASRSTSAGSCARSGSRRASTRTSPGPG